MTIMATGTKPRIDSAVDVLWRSWGQVVLGTLLGITWTASLRAYMTGLAGSTTTFSWWGTFGAIVIPGGISGALLAVAWHHAREGRASAWWALAPLPIAVAPMLEPGGLWALVTTGLGGGAVGVVAAGLIGGFAAGQRGPIWGRSVLAAIWIALIVGFALTPLLVANLPPTTPEGLWLTVLVVGLMILLSLACTAPFLRRRATEPRDTTPRRKDAS